jgi:uridine kinase
MKEYDINDGIHFIAGEIAAKYPTVLRESLIVGITGPVASGKTRFAHSLSHLLRDAYNFPIVYIPFDYWINTENLDAATYSERFHLDDYYCALQSIAGGEQWMYPRYDLTKRRHVVGQWNLPDQESQDVIWQQRRFRKIDDVATQSILKDTDTLYLEVSTQRLFSLSPKVTGAIYLIDGTLIFHSQHIRSLFGVRVFCFSNWPNRIARMLRRYRRSEVFGQATSSLEKYVDFLVREAKNCADYEIAAQMDDDMLMIRSSVQTVSNLLDLHYLKEKLLKGELPMLDEDVLSIDEVDRSIEEAITHLKAVAGEQSSCVIEELHHLHESKHLVSIENVDSIFYDLSKALSQESISVQQPKELTVM